MIHTRLDEVVEKLNASGYAIRSKNQLLVQVGMKSSNASVYANGLKPISDAIMNKLVLKFNINKKFLLYGEYPVLFERKDKVQSEEQLLQYQMKINELESENKLLRDINESLKQSIADKNKIISLLEAQVALVHTN